MQQRPPQQSRRLLRRFENVSNDISRRGWRRCGWGAVSRRAYWRCCCSDRLAAALIALLLVRCHLSSSEVRAAPAGLQRADARGNSSDLELLRLCWESQAQRVLEVQLSRTDAVLTCEVLRRAGGRYRPDGGAVRGLGKEAGTAAEHGGRRADVTAQLWRHRQIAPPLASAERVFARREQGGAWQEHWAPVVDGVLSTYLTVIRGFLSIAICTAVWT